MLACSVYVRNGLGSLPGKLSCATCPLATFLLAACDLNRLSFSDLVKPVTSGLIVKALACGRAPEVIKALRVQQVRCQNLESQQPCQLLQDFYETLFSDIYQEMPCSIHTL